MEAHRVYCSACDREVRVLYPNPPRDATAAAEVDPSGICVDYCSESCTGAMCSLFDLPPAEMLAMLKRSGLLPG